MASTIVTINISPSVSVCACYCFMLLVSNFYLGELYICASLLSTSIPGDGIRNWWPIMNEEVEIISQCLWVIIYTREVFPLRLDHTVLCLIGSSHSRKDLAKTFLPPLFLDYYCPHHPFLISPVLHVK